jgi:hypothetical protein
LGRFSKVSKLISTEVIVPACTFTIGVIATILITDYLEKHNPVLFALTGVLLLLSMLVALSVKVLYSNEESLATIDAKVVQLVNKIGLSVEYIPDGATGQSYLRAAALIENARESLTFVDMWEPFEHYNTGTTARLDARRRFYESIINQVEHHKNSREMFHRRIVQVPPDYADQPVPFNLDPYLDDYLRYMIRIQASHYEACSVRITPIHVIKTHFIIVDRRYIILPVLTTDAATNQQIRHGALFFDDRDGDLFRSLRGIYRAIDVQAYPLAERHLVGSSTAVIRPEADRSTNE